MQAIVLDDHGARLELGGLTLLERMVVMLHRAGCSPLLIAGEQPLPRWRRLQALGIHPAHRAQPPAGTEAIVASGALFVLPGDVARTIAACGRLVDAEGRPLPLGLQQAAPARTPPPAIRAHGPAFLVQDEAARRRADKALWESLRSDADGFVDRWLNRPLGRPLSRLLVHTEVSPNLVTVLGTLLALAGCVLIGWGDAAHAVVGAVLFQLAAAVDCVDGELARLLFKESRLGQRLDLGLDNLAHAALFAAIALHVMRTAPGVPALALGVSAVAGALMSLLAVLRAGRLPPARRGALLERLLALLANRDFTLLVLVLAVAGRLELFLWLAGTLSHGFWIAVALAQARAGRAGPALAAAARSAATPPAAAPPAAPPAPCARPRPAASETARTGGAEGG